MARAVSRYNSNLGVFGGAEPNRNHMGRAMSKISLFKLAKRTAFVYS